MGYFSDIECDYKQVPNIESILARHRDEKIIDLQAGKATSYLLTSSGALYACGCYIGNGTCVATFTMIRADIISMSAGRDHLIMIARQNMVITIGSNQYGYVHTLDNNFSQLGDASNNPNTDPSGINLYINAHMAVASSYYNVMLINSKLMMAFGSMAPIGDGCKAYRFKLAVVDLIQVQNETSGFEYLVGAAHDAFAIGKSGRVYGWGFNEYSLQGLKGGSVDIPQQLPTSVLNEPVETMSCYRTCVAYTSSGELVSWGDQTFGYE